MKKILYILVFLALPLLLHGQSKKFDDILKISQQNSGVLYDDEEVKGYYFFYTLGKSGKGNRTYLLSIMDENLNEVKTQVIEESKRTALIEGSFNGKEIIMKLYDYKEKKAIFLSYDNRGEFVERVEEPIENKSELIRYGANGELSSARNLLGISELGFINYTLHNKAKGYKIEMIPTSEEVKPWKLESSDNSNIETVGNLFASKDIILNVILKRPGITSNKISFHIQGINPITGKVEFEKEVKDKYVHQPFTAYKDNKTGLYNIMGIYYPEDVKKVGKETGIGMFKYSIDNSGNVSNKSYLLWSGNASDHIPVDLKGRMDGSYVYFHNIIQKPDGSILAVGEQYRKTADAGGIAATVLFGSGVASTTKIVIEDLLIFEFDPSFELKKLERINKTKSNFLLPSGYDFINVHLLAGFVKANGGFGYSFTQENRKDDVISIGYIDYEKDGSGPRQWAFGAVSIDDQDYIKDKFKLDKSSRDFVRLFPAKPGYVGINQYSRKEKSAEIRLERINF